MTAGALPLLMPMSTNAIGTPNSEVFPAQSVATTSKSNGVSVLGEVMRYGQNADWPRLPKSGCVPGSASVGVTFVRIRTLRKGISRGSYDRSGSRTTMKNRCQRYAM